jgi:hypothetical protein
MSAPTDNAQPDVKEPIVAGDGEQMANGLPKTQNDAKASKLLEGERNGDHEVSSSKWEHRRVVSDIWKNWFQVIALSIAGIWAVFTFALQSLPNREKQFTSEYSLTWSDGPTPETCVADFYVKVRNISARSVDVRQVDVRMWSYRPPVPSGDEPGYVDAETFRPKGDHYLSQKKFTLSDDPLVDRYAPNGVSDNTFEWVFRRPKVPAWISLEVELYGDKAASESLWFASETSAVCPE